MAQNPNPVYDLTNLMIPAFGAVRMITNSFNAVMGYVLDMNTITIDSVPFRPQSVTLDCSDVPDTETVIFKIEQINFQKKITGGNNVTFNFPSIPNMRFDVTPSDNTSEVRAFFYNFPSFPDEEQVNVITSGGGGAQNVNIESVDPALTIPVGLVSPFNTVQIDQTTFPNVNVNVTNTNQRVNEGTYIDTYLNQEILTASILVNVSAGGGVSASNTILSAIAGQRWIILDGSISYLNLTFNNAFLHYLQYPGNRMFQFSMPPGLQNIAMQWRPKEPFITAQNSAVTLNTEVISAVTSSTAGLYRILLRYIQLP